MNYLILLGLWYAILINACENHNPIHSLNHDTSTHPIQYDRCESSLQLEFKPFPLAYTHNQQPCNLTILETFIAHIPQGKVYCEDGIIIHDEHILQDLIWQNDVSQKDYVYHIKINELGTPTKIAGSVAVIAQNGQFCYYHWMTEVLGRLLLLKSHNISYDYLYAPLSKSYMQESLQLFGVHHATIIDARQHTYLQADKLIVPSLVNQVRPTPTLASYPSPKIIGMLRDLFLPQVKSLIQHYTQNNASKKIFISRKDANVRKVTNEDELFEKLRVYGFERYCLSELSMLEQIALFHYADSIVGVHGAGLTNLIFCKPGTEVIEIFQARPDATYWYVSQTLNLQHTCIQTCDFDQKENSVGFFDTTLSQESIDLILTSITKIA